MSIRKWTAAVTFVVHTISWGLLVYGSVTGGQGISDAIYFVFQNADTSAATPGDAGRFLVALWWFLAFAGGALAFVSANILVVTDSGWAVLPKVLWVVALWLVPIVTVFLVCVLEMFRGPNQSFKPNPLRGSA
jgi:hypothetical protein